MDPSVFRRYFREEEEETQERDAEGAENDASTAGGYNRSDVRDYKMPRRKTTRRRKPRKPPDSDSPRLVDISSPTVVSPGRGTTEEEQPQDQGGQTSHNTRLSHQDHPPDQQLEKKIDQIGRQGENARGHYYTILLQTIELARAADQHRHGGDDELAGAAGGDHGGRVHGGWDLRH